MSNQRLACAKDKSFRDPQGRSYAPGQLISERNIKEIGEARIAQLIAKGRIVVIEMDAPAEDAPAPKPNPAAAEAAKAAAKAKAAEKKAVKAKAAEKEAAKAAEKAAADAQKSNDEKRVENSRVTPSRWNMDPADLADLELDDLNLMIFDIDDAAKPCESIEDAIHLLSADYMPGDEAKAEV